MDPWFSRGPFSLGVQIGIQSSRPPPSGGGLLSMKFYDRRLKLVGQDRFFLLKAGRFVVPIRANRTQRGLYCTRVVAAEKQLTAGGLKYNADIRLCPATIAPVESIECAVCN